MAFLENLCNVSCQPAAKKLRNCLMPAMLEPCQRTVQASEAAEVST